MKLRLYRDDSSTNPDIDRGHMKLQVHALFCQWVKSNYNVRDFIDAIEHRATVPFIEYLMGNSPEIPESLLLPDSVTLLSLEPFFEEPQTADELKPRFYLADGNLNSAILLEEDFEAVLVQLFGHWVHRGYHARDFIQATKDCAQTVYASYETSCSMGGLGGCKTREQYLNTRPAA
jgi:hypothetical protein